METKSSQPRWRPRVDKGWLSHDWSVSSEAQNKVFIENGSFFTHSPGWREDDWREWAVFNFVDALEVLSLFLSLVGLVCGWQRRSLVWGGIWINIKKGSFSTCSPEPSATTTITVVCTYMYAYNLFHCKQHINDCYIIVCALYNKYGES